MLEDKLYTINELAKITNLTDRTIRNYLAKGNLTGIKVGGQWRFSKDDILKFFSDSKFECDVKSKTERNMLDFYRSNDKNEAFITIKKVMKNRKKLIEMFQKIEKVSTSKSKRVSFVDDDGNLTVTIVGDFQEIIDVLSIVKEY